MTIAGKSLQSTGPTYRSSETCETVERQTSLPLISSVEASRASHFPLPDSNEAQQMTVTSGLKCSALLKNSTPLSYLVKTFLASSNLRSKMCVLIWKSQVTKSNRLLFQLVAPMRPITGVESGWLPTPTARDWKGYTTRGTESVCNYLKPIYGKSGKPSPEWTEWRLGFPEGWTDLKHSETPLSHKSQSSLDALF